MYREKKNFSQDTPTALHCKQEENKTKQNSYRLFTLFMFGYTVLHAKCTKNDTPHQHTYAVRQMMWLYLFITNDEMLGATFWFHSL